MDHLSELPRAVREQIESRLTLANEAVKLFGEQPGYARIRVRLAGQAEHQREVAGLEFRSETRAKIVLKWFDTQARALLPLVTSEKLLEAYNNFLAYRRDLAWHEFTGHPWYVFPASGKFLVGIEEKLNARVRLWRTKASARITLGAHTSSIKGQIDKVADERATALNAFKSRAREKGIRVTDEMIAKAAKPGKWNDRTMVTWWKRNDRRCKLAHDKLIRDVLASYPASKWPPTAKPKRALK